MMIHMCDICGVICDGVSGLVDEPAIIGRCLGQRAGMSQVGESARVYVMENTSFRPTPR